MENMNSDYVSEYMYFTFIIGLELIPKEKASGFGCDELYDYASYIATDFLQSEEYKDLKHSGYEMLYNYFDNRGGSEKMFDEYFKE